MVFAHGASSMRILKKFAKKKLDVAQQMLYFYINCCLVDVVLDSKVERFQNET